MKRLATTVVWLVAFMLLTGGSAASSLALTSCYIGPYVVFFDWDSAELDDYDKETLRRIVSVQGNCGAKILHVAGHADLSGDADYNVVLSKRRSEAVITFLHAENMPLTDIRSDAFGESAPLIQTDDGIREPQNRRVEMAYDFDEKPPLRTNP